MNVKIQASLARLGRAAIALGEITARTAETPAKRLENSTAEMLACATVERLSLEHYHVVMSVAAEEMDEEVLPEIDIVEDYSSPALFDLVMEPFDGP
jgi:hypothetical protein